MRYAALAAMAALLAGCAGPQRMPPIEVWPDMDRQEKYKAQAPSELFSDGRSNRRPVEGTVAVGYLKEDTLFATGLDPNGMYTGKIPVEVTPELLKQGQRRYNTYCSPCHDRTGQGQGVVPKRTTWLPTNLMEDRVQTMPDGEIYNVVSHGRRSMPGYRFQIVERDRWAIVSYVRALQRATRGTVEDVPSDLRSDLR
jgi:mono/diheme cytochrome c family protein